MTKSQNWKSGLMLMICKEERAVCPRDVLSDFLVIQTSTPSPEKFSDRVGGWNPGLLILSPVDFPPTPTLIPTPPPYSSKVKKEGGEGVFLNHEEIHSKVKKKRKKMIMN